MKVAIVDKNAKTRLRTKLILERTNPEHIYETYVGICPWPELTDPSIEMMVIGSPMMSMRGIPIDDIEYDAFGNASRLSGVLLDLVNEPEWVSSGLDYMEAIRLGHTWYLSGKMSETLDIPSRTKKQLPILFINNSPLPRDWPPNRKHETQFKNTFYKTCGANAVCGYPFDDNALSSAFREALDTQRLYKLDIDWHHGR